MRIFTRRPRPYLQPALDKAGRRVKRELRQQALDLTVMPSDPPPLPSSPNPVADLILLVGALQQRIYRLEEHHKGELPPLPPNPIETMRQGDQ